MFNWMFIRKPEAQLTALINDLFQFQGLPKSEFTCH